MLELPAAHSEHPILLQQNRKSMAAKYLTQACQGECLVCDEVFLLIVKQLFDSNKLQTTLECFFILIYFAQSHEALLLVI